MIDGRRGLPTTIVSDQPGMPVQNAFAESFNGRLRDEMLNQTQFQSFRDTREGLLKPALNALAVQLDALAPQQHVQTAIPEAATLPGQLTQPPAQFAIVRARRPIARAGPIHACNSGRPPLAHLMDLHKIRDRFASGGGRHYFRDS